MDKAKQHIESKKQNWIEPDSKLSRSEFNTAIKNAEQASFISVQQSMLNFDKWLKSREKK